MAMINCSQNQERLLKEKLKGGIENKDLILSVPKGTLPLAANIVRCCLNLGLNRNLNV
jgi:hypothetical protein